MRAQLFFLCGASALSLLVQPVQAQTVSSTDASQAGSNEAEVGVTDIIVTAQRRDQRLQDVPITISAIGASTLANVGVTSISQLQQAAPGLQLNQQVGPVNIYLRGVGVKSGDLLAENSVAIYVDGVYQPAAMANVFEFNGLERIEVLRGPQGTLFGRNATGGVVQVITKDPTPTPEMNFDIGYANYQTISASAYVSGGLTDTLAANLAIQYKDQNKGWGKNITTGEERYFSRDFNVRGKLKFTPDDATDIILSANYGDFSHNNLDPQNPPGAVLSTGQGYLGRYKTASDSNTYVTGKSYGGSLIATHDFGGFQIRNITAYSHFKGFEALDQDGGPEYKVRGEFFAKTRMISEEFHVLSPTGSRFQWLAGVYYFNYNLAIEPTFVTGDDLQLAFSMAPPPLTIPLFLGVRGVAVYGRDAVRSYAGFAQGTYPLTDKLNLTGGFRYTKDKVTYTGSQALVGGALDGVVIDPEVTKKYNKSSPTWRLSLDYKLTPDVLGYVSWNRGVKSGNFSLGTGAGGNQAFQPEKIDAYEAGLKTQLFDRKLTFNTAAFYYAFKNIQFQKVTNGTVSTINGPSAKIYGLEAEVTARVTPELTLNANGGYLHTRIGDFPNAPNVNRLPNGRDDFGNPNFNAKGNLLPFAPDFSGNVGFNYRLPLEGGHINLASNLYYTSKVVTELDNRLTVGAHELLSASLGWEGNNGLRVSVWGNNLTNKYYYVSLFGVAGANDIGIPGAPRTYGVTLGYTF